MVAVLVADPRDEGWEPAGVVRIRIDGEEQALDWDEWERRVRQGRVPPITLVCIEAVTGDAFVEARTLESYQSLRNEAALAWQHQFLGGPPPVVTALLVGFQIRIWWFAHLRSVNDPLVLWFTNWTSPTLEDGQGWRLVTMGLLHTDVFHLSMNMLWLAYTGWNIERALGRANLVAIYFAAVVFGSVLSMFGAPENPSLGASGGVFGLIAASVAFGLARPELLHPRGRRVFGVALLPYLVIMLYNGLLSPLTDNWSHLGGAVAGFALAFVLDPKPLQRRPGWNRRWHLAIAGAITAAVLGSAVLGPRIAPIYEVEVARERLAARKSEAPRGLLARVGETPAAPLQWSVPAGWSPGVTASGNSGFVSSYPPARRGWAVREHKRDIAVDGEALYEEWLSGLRRGWPTASATEPTPAFVAGYEGWSGRATTESSGLVFEWRGVTRGLWTLEEVWQVDSGSERHLKPLHDRLAKRTSWALPESVTAARRAAEESPHSQRLQAELATALAEVGELDEALELLEEVVEHDPSKADGWIRLLQLQRWYPGHVDAAEAHREGALLARPTAAMSLEVLRCLEDAGDDQTAIGLLELAWLHHPGDRRLRRARSRWGLPNALDETTLLPRHLALDPRSGEILPEEQLTALRALPLTLGAARTMGQERAAVRTELTAEAVSLARAGDPLAWDRVVALKDGAVHQDKERVIAAFVTRAERLDPAEPPRWLDSNVIAALIDGGLLPDLH